MTNAAPRKRKKKTETVNERLKRLRLSRPGAESKVTDPTKPGFIPMSQRELACGGVSYAYISRIEAGARNPSVQALRRLAERLGVTVEYLEFGDEGKPTYPQIENMLESLETVMWNLGLSSLPVERISDPVIVDGIALALEVEIPQSGANGSGVVQEEALAAANS